MIRVAEHVARTDTGRQRATNEDSYLERSPVFVVADGMGGAQAGEVASQLAVAHFARDLPGDDGDAAGTRLVQAVHDANAEIYAIAEADVRRAGMGTTLTAAYVGPSEVCFAHVGDSRAYRWHDGELERITEDHSLVEELLRQGRLTEEEAEEHPQRSIITRALGPEPEVDVDTVAVVAQSGDVFLICSDGLTSMIGDAVIADVLAGAADLDDAANELLAAALAAGGRDNITVVLFRLEEVGAPAGDGEAGPPVDAPTEALEPAAVEDADTEPRPAAQPRAPARRRAPRPPSSPSSDSAPRRRRRRRLGAAAVVIALLAVVAIAALLAAQSVYFIGTDDNGQVAVYNGFPYTLPGGLPLYTKYLVSGITVAELSPLERSRLFNDELRSQAGATALVGQLELGRIRGQ
jgi:protein phosphatase